MSATVQAAAKMSGANSEVVSAMRSGIYEGRVVHERQQPTLHRVRADLMMPCVDLDELDRVAARHRWWSVERPSLVSFRRADYLGDPSIPLSVAVRSLVRERLGIEPTGPVMMLSHWRTAGWVFNPISVYWCLSDDVAPGQMPSDEQVVAVVAEVTNTPWHERHAYVLPGVGTHEVAKAMHVSPFLAMDYTYRISVTAPGPVIDLSIENWRDDRCEFRAALSLRRREVSRASLGRVLWRYPAQTMRVSTSIYAHAARLRAKGVAFQPHPRRTGVVRDGGAT